MGKPVLKVLRKNPEEIRELLNSSPDLLLATRLNMVYHVAKGHSSREVAKWYAVSFKQVVNWVHRFEERGIEGLENRPGRGRKPYITNGDLEKIKRMILEKSPLDYGVKAKKWSGPIILRIIKEKYYIDYKPTQAYKLIEKMGLQFKKGKGIEIKE
jgi:transposase